MRLIADSFMYTVLLLMDRNPAKQLIWRIYPLFTGFYISQVVIAGFLFTIKQLAFEAFEG